MARQKSIRTSVSLDRETVDIIDEIADGFEDFVSRGEAIDIIVGWASDNGLDKAIEELYAEEQGEDQDGDEPE